VVPHAYRSNSAARRERPQAIRLSRPRPEPFPAYAAQLDAIARGAQEFDILHCHTDWIHLPVVIRLGLPHLTTIHNRLDTPDLPPVVRRFPDAPLISISDHHRAPLPSANWLGTVYHGMPAGTLSPSYEPGRYLAFLVGSRKRRVRKRRSASPKPPGSSCAWQPRFPAPRRGAAAANGRWGADQACGRTQ
jgi:hypothetical protein